MEKIIILFIIAINISFCGISDGNMEKGGDKVRLYNGDPIGKLTRIEVNGRYGYKDEKGNIIVNPVYNQLPEKPWELMNVKIDANCGLINFLGDTLIEFGKYQKLKVEHSIQLRRHPNNQHGVEYFSEAGGWNMICQKDDLYGMIDKSESILIPIEFERYKYLFANRYAFYKNGSWTIYDSKGEKKSELEFDEISQIFKYKYSIYEKGNLMGAFDIETNADAIGLHEGLLALDKNILGAKNQDKYMLYRLNGALVSDMKLDTLIVNHGTNSPVGESIRAKYKERKKLGWARQNGKYFFINKEGELIEMK